MAESEGKKMQRGQRSAHFGTDTLHPGYESWDTISLKIWQKNMNRMNTKQFIRPKVLE